MFQGFDLVLKARLNHFVFILICFLVTSALGQETCGSKQLTVNAVAQALDVCPDVRDLLLQRFSTASPGTVNLDSRPSDNLPAAEVFSDKRARRQKILKQIHLNILETDLLSLRIANEKLTSQNAALDDDAHAFRRSKLLNAWLGTGIAGVGTGLQLSHSVDIQRAGNYIGLAGGAATIFFAMCTAELDDDKPTKNASEIVSSSFKPAVPDNALSEDWVFPNALRTYINKTDPDFFQGQPASLSANNSSLAKPKKQRFLSCHFNKKEDKDVTAINTRLDAIEKKLREMNKAADALISELNEVQ